MADVGRDKERERDDSSSEDELDDTLTPAHVLKAQRKQSRRRFTEERTAIAALVDSEGTISALTVRQENLNTLFRDCLNVQNRYILKTVTDDDEQGKAREEEWCKKLQDDFEETAQLITGYHDALKGAAQTHQKTPSRTAAEEDLDGTINRFQQITTPSRAGNEGLTSDVSHGGPVNKNPTNTNEVLSSTSVEVQNQEEAAALTKQIIEERRRLELELIESRVAEERKRDELQQRQLLKEKELRQKLAAVGGSQSHPPPGAKRLHDGSISHGNTSFSLPQISGISALNTSTWQPADSWIFQPFLPITLDPHSGAAMLLLAGAAKISFEPFKGDPKQWPMFIQNFKATVHDVFPTDAQRVCHLRSWLHPDLQKSFSQVLSSPLTYQQALQDLWKRFGRPQLVVQQYIKDLREIQPVRERDASALDQFQQQIHGTIAALETAGYGHELQSSVALADLVGKLPYSMTQRWGRHQAQKLQSSSNVVFHVPTIKDLDKFLEDEVMASKYTSQPASSSLGPRRSEFSGRPSFYSKPQPTSQASMSVNTVSSKQDPKGAESSLTTCGICNKQPGHSPLLCASFMAMLPEQRLKAMRQVDSCFRCLGRNHRQEDCKKVQLFCTSIGCSGTHHGLLHDAFAKSRSNSTKRD